MDAETKGKRIAFFGGSFDPPHLGHLAVAAAAQAALGLDTVLFAPAGAQPLKPSGSNASFADRVGMTRLAIEGRRGFALSLVDAPRPGGDPNYTLDALLRLRSEMARDSNLFCLMGADAFLSLPGWHRAAEIPFAAHLIVASRPGQPLADLQKALPPDLTVDRFADSSGLNLGLNSAQEGLPEHGRLERVRILSPSGESAAMFLLPGLAVEISASEARAAIRAGFWSAAANAAPQTGMLPRAVLDYIRERGLYR